MIDTVYWENFRKFWIKLPSMQWYCSPSLHGSWTTVQHNKVIPTNEIAHQQIPDTINITSMATSALHIIVFTIKTSEAEI